MVSILTLLIFGIFSLVFASNRPSLKRTHPSTGNGKHSGDSSGSNKRARRAGGETMEERFLQQARELQFLPPMLTRAQAKFEAELVKHESEPARSATATATASQPEPAGEKLTNSNLGFTPSQRQVLAEDLYYAPQPDYDSPWHCPYWRRRDLIRSLCSRLLTIQNPVPMSLEEFEALMDASDEEEFDWESFLHEIQI